MKLYKFRSLTNQGEFERARAIVESGRFWCSKFSELNDPMEGIFSTSMSQTETDVAYNQKSMFKICSFSKEKALSNPIMWGYYASGFKGIAIEIEVNEEEVQKVRYVINIPSLNSLNVKDIRSILSTANPTSFNSITTASESIKKLFQEYEFSNDFEDEIKDFYSKLHIDKNEYGNVDSNAFNFIKAFYMINRCMSPRNNQAQKRELFRVFQKSGKKMGFEMMNAS